MGVLISLIIMLFMPTISPPQEIKLIVRGDDFGVTKAERNISEFQAAAKEGTRGLDSSSSRIGLAAGR
jgi:hypothetical protein